MAGPQPDAARAALDEVLAADQQIAREVPIDRFFGSIRPYNTSHRVGDGHERGANVGDPLRARFEAEVGDRPSAAWRANERFLAVLPRPRCCVRVPPARARETVPGATGRRAP